jgi:alpha-glucosidase
MQKAVNNSNHPDLPNFLERLRALTDQYCSRFTVAEVGGSQTLNVRQEYTKGQTRLNTAYGFELLYLPELDVEAFAQIIGSWSNDPDLGWPSWAFSNHDVPRVHSRWLPHLDDTHRAKLLALLLISLRGNLFIYQGEELGLPQVDIPFELLKDPEALRNWPHTLSRDGARTPMPWLSDVEHAGFSCCNPWLPVPECHKQRAVDSAVGMQLRDHLKQLLSIRNACPELRWGHHNNISGSGDVLRFQRLRDDKCIQAMFNFSEETVVVPEAEIEQSIIWVGEGDSSEEFDGVLPPFSGALYYASTQHA